MSVKNSFKDQAKEKYIEKYINDKRIKHKTFFLNKHEQKVKSICVICLKNEIDGRRVIKTCDTCIKDYPEKIEELKRKKYGHDSYKLEGYASPPQLAVLKKNNIEYKPDITKKEAHEIISEIFKQKNKETT